MTRVLVEALTRYLSESLVANAVTVAVQARNAVGPYTNVDGSRLVTSTRATVVVRGGQVFRDDELLDGVPLVPTDGTFCYQWVVTSRGRQVLTRTTSVPDVDTIDFGDLVDVDPETFQPTEDVVTAWEGVVAEVNAARVAAVVAEESAETAAGAAAASSASAAESAGDAGEFAGSADFDANRAGQSAFQSGQSAAAALGHRNAAQGFSDEAKAAAASFVRDVPGGVPTLDGDSRVPDARLPTRLAAAALSRAFVTVRTADGQTLPPGTIVVITLDKTLAQVTEDPVADIDDITFESGS